MKKDSTVTVSANIDSIIGCNYLFYDNIGFTNKRYYCFITNMTYVNENTTRITFETDCFQTWYFELQYNRCFVEREHVNDDTPGLHTVPEDVDTGDYIVDFEKTNLFLTPYKIILGVTVDYSIDSQTGVVTIQGDNGGGIYGGIKTAYKYYYFESNQAISKLPDVLKAYANAGKSDAIGQMFIAPTFLINKTYPEVLDDGDINDDYQPVTLYWNDNQPWDLTRPFNLNGYVPKNKKLLCYPYCYLLMSNNNGGNVIYNYEYFETNASTEYSIDFLIRGVLTPSMSGIIAPINYKGLPVNYSESLQLPKYPICGWNTDVYTNWLTQQGINNVANIIKSTGSGASGGAVFGAGGMLLGGLAGLINSTGNIIMDMKNHEFIPPQANGNTNTGDVNTSMNRNTFTAYGMCIRPEYAEIIDNYLSIQGYKVNSVKIPNITGRRNWNYVKTTNSNVDGDIPQSDLNIIKTMFNNGVTFWHNPATMFDYSQDNSII